MSASKVRIGIIGTGFGAAVQLPGFLALKNAKVIGIASHDPERSKALQKEYRLPQAFESAETLLASDDIDLVSIATAPADHERLVRAAIRAGKHVLCEKPFTLSSVAALSLLKEANASGIIHATDFEFCELPAITFLRSRLMTATVGSIQSGEFRWIVGSWADPKRPWQWQCDLLQGGGVLTALGVHLYHAAELILGPLYSVMAETGIMITQRTDRKGETRLVTSEDHATIELKGKYGIPVRLILSNVDPAGTGFGLSIKGEKGVLLLESTSQNYGSGLRVREGKTHAEAKIVYEDPEPPAGLDPRILLFQSFAERLLVAIQNRDRTFQPSFQEGVRAQFFLEGVRTSSATARWVDMGQHSK